jgi:hypothetical protein
MARPLLPAVRRISPLASLDELRQAVDDLQEFVQTREPLESGDPLDKYLTLRSAVSSGLLVYQGQGGGGSGGTIGVPPTTPVPPLNYDDLTPPDPLTGLSVTSLPTGFFVEFDAPSYSQGAGNAYSIIYRANYDGTPPLPTFGDAAEVGRTTQRSPILVLAAEPGTISHFWAQPVSHAEDFNGIAPQTPPTGGTNGVSATAGKIDGADHVVALSIGTAQIAALAVTDAKIANLSADKLIANSLAVGVELKSTGFVSGSFGFYLEAGGDAEFNNIVARGTIYASAGLIGGALIGTTYVQSTNYNGTGDGWKLDNANDKILAGKITISNTGATRVLNTEATGTNPVLKVGSSLSLLADGTGTLGALAIAASGYIRQGQTAYATGTGFWLGDASGTTKFSIGSSTSYMRWDGTDLLLTKPLFDAFSVSIGSDITADQPAGGAFTIGTPTATPSGGKPPYSYNWMLQLQSQSTASSIFISSGLTSATVTVQGFSSGGDFVSPREYRYARLTCFVSDANGRVTTDSIEVEAGFAADIVSGE